MRGAMIPAVVVMATVEDPWAVFRMADSRKGKKIPRLAKVLEFSLMNATILVEAMTFPNTPPAAVMNRMGPTTFRVSSVIS